MTAPTAPPSGALIGVTQASPYTNPDGSFNVNGAANSTTDPSGSVTTGTDLYGLTTKEEQWSFYLGNSGNTMQDVPRTGSVERSQVPKFSAESPTLAYENALTIMQKFAALGTSAKQADRQSFANLQQQLFAMGSYGTATSGAATAPRFGVWTDMDAKALLAAMRSYQQVAGPDGAQQPITFEEYLSQASGQAAANGQGNGTGGSGGVQPGTQRPILTDAATLKADAQSAATTALGHLLTEGQLDQFVTEFQTRQSKNFADSAGGAGIFMDKSDPNADAQAFVQQIDPTGFNQTKVSQYAGVLTNLLMSGQPTKAPETPGSLDQTVAMTQ